jgi:demethylspheroidene O-methyltransferase
MGQPVPLGKYSEPSQSWRELWLNWRNRLLINPGFQRWAARFPLTRPITRRRVKGLFDLVAGFVYSQTLAACVEVGLLDLLQPGPQPLGRLAQGMALPVASAQRLLRAAVALDLAESLPGERYALGVQGAALLGNPSVQAMIRHHAMLYADLQDPVALLRGEAPPTQLARYWAYAGSASPETSAPDRVAAYSTLMAQSQALVADEVLDAYSLGDHLHLLDLGGGEGVFLSRAGQRHSHLALTLFDLPAVVDRAGLRMQAAGLSARARLVGGSFFEDELPGGADVISLVRVLHDHDDDAVMKILRRARAALAPGGKLLIAEPMAGTSGAEAAGDAYFGFYLAAMGSGRPRRPDELSAMLSAAGFRHSQMVATHTPLIVRLMVALS